ncbi:MAG: ATP-grasp domain-containing protein [Candidatus Omnitrophota bacterium]|nr:ATP-grasp domain-containing protein [Candidatus Omnitrophota bacterium]
MRIGLTYDLQTDPTDDRQAEFDQPRTIAALETALQTLGHPVVPLGNAEQLAAAPWRLEEVALVFNIAEGSHGRCREAWVPMLLEQWGVPFVGSGATAQALGLDKVMSKRLASASGIATPRWAVVDGHNEVAVAHAGELKFPLIVKPRSEGSGFGIDAGAVVHDLPSLARRAQWLTGRLHQPCLVEEFIPFGELTVFLIGNHPPQVLPVVQRPIDPASRLSCHVLGEEVRAWLCPVELTPALEAAAAKIAVTMFEALRCRDLARVDLRVAEDGTLFFLEINPLPSFDPEGSLGLIAEYLGTTYTALVHQVLNAALQRLEIPQAPSPDRV